MTLPMIIALAVTVLMIILIMVDKLPFGAPPLLALLLLVVFGVTDIKTAFGGFANPTIVMLASFMAIIAALQKTSFIVKFKQTMFNMANKGGFKAYVLLILIVMLGCSLFGTGSTAYYVLVIGLLSTLPYSKQLPPSKVLMPAGFAANHPLLPFNTALQYGIVIAVLESAGVAANVNLVKFSLVNLCLSIGFLVWCILAYKIMPDHPIAEAKEEALHAGEQKVALTKNQELITYFSFVLAVVGMILQSKIGDAGYAITGLAVGVILISGVMDFNEIRNSISAPIILMSAGRHRHRRCSGQHRPDQSGGRDRCQDAGHQRQPLRADLRFLHPDQPAGHPDRFHHRHRVRLCSHGHCHLRQSGSGPHRSRCRYRGLRLVRTLPAH